MIKPLTNMKGIATRKNREVRRLIATFPKYGGKSAGLTMSDLPFANELKTLVQNIRQAAESAKIIKSLYQTPRPKHR